MEKGNREFPVANCMMKIAEGVLIDGKGHRNGFSLMELFFNIFFLLQSALQLSQKPSLHCDDHTTLGNYTLIKKITTYRPC